MKPYFFIPISLCALLTNIENSKAIENHHIISKYISTYYGIDIYYACMEGDLSCNKITYHGVNTQTKKEVTLHGKVITRGHDLNFVGLSI